MEARVPTHWFRVKEYSFVGPWSPMAARWCLPTASLLETTLTSGPNRLVATNAIKAWLATPFEEIQPAFSLLLGWYEARLSAV
jgi:hypothetical protein